MAPDTEAKFVAFLLQCGEGSKDYGYLDQSEPEPVVTVAIGCAVFTYQQWAALDWRNPDGTAATIAQKMAAWSAVRARKDLAKDGGGAFAKLTTIRLSQAAVDALVHQKVLQFEAELRPLFPGYDAAPPEAQEGLLRLAWATGAESFIERWPKFSEAWNAQQWATCAREDVMPGLVGEPNANALETQLFAGLAAAQQQQAAS